MKDDGREDTGEACKGLVFCEPLIFEMGAPERVGIVSADVDTEGWEALVPRGYKRAELPLPELTEPEVVRHFTRLSQWNFSVDTGFYPLGSCTMKYNPKINEEMAGLKGFAALHPYQPERLVQGAMRLMYELENYLAEITGMDAVSLQPAAGAQGELTGMLMVRALHRHRGRGRHKVLIPDSAHGTNPASCALCGFEVIEVSSDERGLLNPEDLRAKMDEDVAALMLTNPNTLGLFEEDIVELCRIVHEKGGLVYCDGANLNALTGITRPGDMGIDIVHMNLHKTFSTPHGGGGPGSGPVGVKAVLEPFLPVPRLVHQGGAFTFSDDHPESIGKMKAFFGQFGVLVRAYAYLLSQGAQGLKEAAEAAVVNANYIRVSLRDVYDLPYDRICKHECVFSDSNQARRGIQTIDIAKRLIDYGFHPPTIYFPLIVKGALMIEPTETETRETLDRFIAAMRAIAQEDPGLLHSAPHASQCARLDEVRAARKPVLVAPE
jgi:glycine dehydrogenase subunit 2